VTPAANTDELTDFFGRYGSALAAGDLPAIARCYALPGLVVSGSYSFTFTSPAAVALSFLGAAPTYADRQVVAAHAQMHDVQQLGGNLALVAVEWEYLDCTGHAVPGERYHYVVRSESTGPRICTVLKTGIATS
jgi:hypothetical protein